MASRGRYHKTEARHKRAAPDHRADPLHEPERSPPAGLLTDDPYETRWYRPEAPLYGSDGRIKNAERIEETRRMARMHDPPAAPKRINARNITAAVLTICLAVPTLFAAGWVARQDKTTTTQQIVRVSYLPLTLYSGQDRSPTKICLVIDASAKAWATNAPCEAAPAQAGQTQPTNAGS